MAIYLDTHAAEETLTRMQIQIRDVGHEIIPQQLIEWQREDMHRQFTNVDSDQEYVSWFTLIWPRSRTYQGKPGTFVGKGVRRRHRKPLSARPRLIGGGAAKHSTRPILRPVLFQQLRDRMSEMLSVNLSWVTSRMTGAQPPQTEGGRATPYSKYRVV